MKSIFKILSFSMLISCSSSKDDGSGLSASDKAAVATAIEAVGVKTIVTQLQESKSQLENTSYTQSLTGYSYTPTQQVSISEAIDSLTTVLENMTEEELVGVITLPVAEMPEDLSSSLDTFIDATFPDESQYDYFILDIPELSDLKNEISRKETDLARKQTASECPTTSFAYNLVKLAGNTIPISADYLRCNLLGRGSSGAAQAQQKQIQKQTAALTGRPYCSDDVLGKGKVCVPFGANISLKDNNPESDSEVVLHSATAMNEYCVLYEVAQTCFIGGCDTCEDGFQKIDTNCYSLKSCNQTSDCQWNPVFGEKPSDYVCSNSRCQYKKLNNQCTFGFVWLKRELEGCFVEGSVRHCYYKAGQTVYKTPATQVTGIKAKGGSL